MLPSSIWAASEHRVFLQHPKAMHLFPHQEEHFGVLIIATEEVKQAKFAHARKVLRGYLDQDHNGIADNQRVKEALITNNATLIMAENEDTWGDAFERLLELAEQLTPSLDIDGQSLYANETNPHGQFDASLEEILHLITQQGYATAYPKVWGEFAGSQVANFMDKARGGLFRSVPKNYPNKAWYHYDDSTCDYSCQITEYVYWALTSSFGAQTDREEDIEDEWQLHSAVLLKQRDPTMWQLMHHPIYGLPTSHPLN